MAEKRGVTKKIKQDLIDMDATLKDLDKYLKQLHDDLSKMMGTSTTGSGVVGPQWNGSKAKRFYQKAVKNLENNITDYNYAANLIHQLDSYYLVVANKDSL